MFVAQVSAEEKPENWESIDETEEDVTAMKPMESEDGTVTKNSEPLEAKEPEPTAWASANVARLIHPYSERMWHHHVAV